jgi:hypothetical protein
VPHFPAGSIEAVQFTGPESVAAVADLVRRYRPQVNHVSATALGTLRFYNSGPELHLKLQDWVAVIGGDVAVIPPSMFEESTVPGSE